jgi:hypothetical protein
MTAVMAPRRGGGYADGIGNIMKKALENPAHPERICWGCPKYCPADDLACGNGTVRTQHPCELFGDDWREWIDSRRGSSRSSTSDSRTPPSR